MLFFSHFESPYLLVLTLNLNLILMNERPRFIGIHSYRGCFFCCDQCLSLWEQISWKFEIEHLFNYDFSSDALSATTPPVLGKISDGIRVSQVQCKSRRIRFCLSVQKKKKDQVEGVNLERTLLIAFLSFYTPRKWGKNPRDSTIESHGINVTLGGLQS